MDSTKQLMADAKFYMGYARWKDEGGYETWNEAVERVMNMHKNRYTDELTPELYEYISVAEEAYKSKKILGAQRALQFGGNQLFKHNARMYNCLKKDTAFVTSEGVKTFEDFKDGDTVRVLTHKGAWKQAKVKQYGEQRLFEYRFVKGNSEDHIVNATANHRWILKDGSETTNLKVGDCIYKPENTFGEFDYENSTPTERMYWCYGMVYGDGTKVKNGSGEYAYSMIRLCGADKQFAGRFEEMSFKTSTNDSLNGDFYAYTGSYLKTAPNPEVDSPELIRAFVAGYLQADGAKSGNSHGSKYISIQSSEEDHIEFIRKCFPIAGVWIISEKDMTGQETNFGVRGRTISFRISDSMGSKYNQGWVVKSVEERNVEQVWCLEVEDDKSFILPNGIVTGNCTVSYTDRPRFFSEAMYLLLCGCGVGFSVQKQHIEKLPTLKKRFEKKVKVYQVPDTIEGWADSFGVLLSSYFSEQQQFPEYAGCQVHFDFSKIRPKGAEISGGFKAPGPDGLRSALQKCEALLEKAIANGETKMKSIVAYDFVMHMSDAVLSGGVRRSATICLFSKDDQDMLNAKTGNWFIDNPQRGRSNNSVMLLREELDREEWSEIMKSVKEFGEPGFIFTDHLDNLYNPCVEIGMQAYDEYGETGWQFCNLVEQNGGACHTPEDFYEICKAASILSTLQAGYTRFDYLSEATKRIVEKEALIGASITGWMNNPEVLFNEEVLKKGAEIVKETNAKVAKLVGINQAARTTCVKPSGNASVLLMTASGIHGEHAPRYLRNVQMNEQDDVLGLIHERNPKMAEASVWSANGTDYVVSFPITAEKGSIYKKELLGVKQLEYVKKAQQTWVEHGTNEHLCVRPDIRHNVSNTISVDNWEEVEQYLFDNRKWFAGVSLLSATGDKDYPQAPFTEVLTPEGMFETYGSGALFASGLVVDALQAFNNNLWTATSTLQGVNKLSEEKEDLLKRDWVRRANKFAKNYFGGDIIKMTECLKDCYNLHKWESIERSFKPMNFAEELKEKIFVDVGTMGAQACSGGACEVSF